MIKKLEIRNFKSHKFTEVVTGSLTVLTGQNGVGKSSLIQSLLTLRQTHMKSRLGSILDLNSPLCFIGKTKDVAYLYPDGEQADQLAIKIWDDTKSYQWAFDITKESTFLTRINDEKDSDKYENLPLFTDKFQFLSAARGSVYSTDNYAVEVQKQLSIAEGKGELTAQYLHTFGKELKVNKSMWHIAEDDPFLLSQANAWEREISKGVNLKPLTVGEGFEIRYSFENERYGETEAFTSNNVGFGLSYALPVIVAILTSEPGSLLLIENPEAHLHPYGQAKMAELICLAAQAGIQLIVETHSDHIINGIMIQSKKFEQQQIGINKDNLKIYSFERDDVEHKTVVTEVLVEDRGRLKNRPTTFFDQAGKDLRTLL